MPNLSRSRPRVSPKSKATTRSWPGTFTWDLKPGSAVASRPNQRAGPPWDLRPEGGRRGRAAPAAPGTSCRWRRARCPPARWRRRALTAGAVDARGTPARRSSSPRTGRDCGSPLTRERAGQFEGRGMPLFQLAGDADRVRRCVGSGERGEDEGPGRKEDRDSEAQWGPVVHEGVKAGECLIDAPPGARLS